MTWFFFCYWYEPDAPQDPVGLVRIWTLADALTKAGDRVTVFPPRYRSALIQRACAIIPIHLLHLPLMRPLSYAVLSFVRGLIRAFVTKPDIVYYRWMDSPHAWLLAKSLSVPCVCEVNGEPVPPWPDGRKTFVRGLKHLFAQLTLKRCDRIVVLTEGLRVLLQERYGVPHDRILVLPSGTDVQRFVSRDATACRLELGLSPERPYIGFIGSVYRYQGLRCLLDSMTMVKQAYPAAELLLVGDGEATEELKQQAKKMGLEGSITWAGRIPYGEVPTWIGAMTVCVAPFRGDRGETSPVKLFDYLACHRPVVASAIPSVVSIFTADSGVRLVRPDDARLLADAILVLLNDPTLCGSLGRQGRQFIEERFSWMAIAKRLRQWVSEDLGVMRHAHSHVL
ncbi:MAG: hypothetical protein A4E19_01775 [Nitrospira sp. SG-bin1]|nr:MAG: hypothetical protein A4E19_01775 [Nitrospira sp. SG-bin1]